MLPYDEPQPKILVAYATFAGSTAEIAEEIGRTLSVHGFAADVRTVESKPPVAAYDAAVIGSAVQHARWLPAAVEFVKANHEALNTIPVALFTVHITNQGDDPQSRETRETYLDLVRPWLEPVDEAFFGGRFDQRGAARLMPGLIARVVPTTDLRNWGRINEWAASLAARLQRELGATQRAAEAPLRQPL
jgi:menaquinone-dependent protoporphyrinogen oxidase